MNNNVLIRKAKFSDLDNILLIYEIARQFMKDTNNPNQWKNNSPEVSLIKEYIKNNQFYVGYVKNDEENLLFSFAFIIGNDETYNYIENGKWLNEESYGVIHSLASGRKINNVFDYVFNFAKSKIDNIRIDTHQDNLIMQKILEKYHFKYCGIIYLKNGESRLAYQFIDTN